MIYNIVHLYQKKLKNYWYHNLKNINTQWTYFFVKNILIIFFNVFR